MIQIKQKKSVEVDPHMTQMWELTDKNFKIIISKT